MSLLLAQPKMDFTAPVRVTATLDPPVVRPGQEAFYRVTFTALEQSIAMPDKITAPPQLEIRPGAHGQVLGMAGPNLQPSTTFNFRVRASAAGEFVIPQFTVNVYGKPVTVPEARVQVVPHLPPLAALAQKLVLELATTNLYVGQAIRARVLSPSPPGGVVQGLGQVQLTGPGILVDQTTVRQRIDMTPRSSPQNATYVYETTLTPISAGKLTVSAQGFTSGFRFSGPVMITGGQGGVSTPMPVYTLLESDPVTLQVRPLPRDGELPGFTGGIGRFTLDPPRLSTNVARVGDPVKLTITAHSDTNFGRLVPPPAPRVPDWQVLPASSEAQPGQSFVMPGLTSFTYTLIPLTEQARETPAIPFSCFDPWRGNYVDLTIPAVPVLVLPGTAPADVEALRQPDVTEPPPEKEPVLSGLASTPGLTSSNLEPLQRRAWFPLVQLAPGLALLALWSWDRRRRYLEQHPHVVLCRRARRALRRERRALQRAAVAGDGPRFAATAVSAMRVACAPHYPAEPRALVGSDVLPLLPEAHRSNGIGEVVRHFFDTADAARFAMTRPETSQLLSYQPQIERVLQELEEKLCP